MEDLKRVEQFICNNITKRFTASLKTDDSIVLQFTVSCELEQKEIESAIIKSEAIFNGRDYELGFTNINTKSYNCIVKTWCSSTEEGMQYLAYNGYEPIERVENSDYFICGRVGSKLSDVRLLEVDKGPMNLF